MTADLPNVTIDFSAGQLLVDYCRQTGIGPREPRPGTPPVRPRQLLNRLLANGRSNTDDDTCVVGIQLP